MDLGQTSWVPTGPDALLPLLHTLSRGDWGNVLTFTVRGGEQRWAAAGPAACCCRPAAAQAAAQPSPLVPARRGVLLLLGEPRLHSNPTAPCSCLAQVLVPGFASPLPVALVLRDGRIHDVWVSMHESMAVDHQYRFAVYGPAIATDAACRGTAASAAALLRLLPPLAKLFDPVDKALRSLPHL